MPDRPSDDRSVAAIGERLLLTRQALGLAQGVFAARAGIAHNTYNQYEAGKKRPSVQNAIALCETYDLTLDWIYRGDNSGLPLRLWDAIKSLRSVRR